MRANRNLRLEPGMPVIPSTGRLRQEDGKLDTNLSYQTRIFLFKNNRNTRLGLKSLIETDLIALIKLKTFCKVDLGGKPPACGPACAVGEYKGSYVI